MDFKDVNNSIIVFSRHAKDKDDHLVCLLNFTPQVHHDYRMGVPAPIDYQEIMSTDSLEFCGSNVSNQGIKHPIHEPMGETPYHVKVTVPPLGGIILKPV